MAFLQILYLLSTIDRYLLVLMGESVKADLKLTDVQFSLLIGGPFSICMAIATLPLGWLSTRYDRFKVVGVGVTFWSLCAVASGVTRTFGQLLGARLGLAVGEACLAPAGFSLIGDVFPRRRVSLATALFSLASGLGAGCAFLFGGMLVQMLGSETFRVFGATTGLKPWQLTFLVVGLAGLPFGVAALFLTDPVRRLGRERARTHPMLSAIRGQYRFYALFFGGFAVASSVAYGMAAWSVIHMQRHFGMSQAASGRALGLTLIVGALISHPVAGLLTDRMVEKGRKDAHLITYIAALAVGAPIGIFGFISNDQTVFLFCFFVVFLLVSPYLVYAVAAIQIFCAPDLRPLTISCLTLIVGLFGASGGPLFIALLTDHVFHNERMVGHSIAILIGLGSLFAICLVALARRPLLRLCDEEGHLEIGAN